MERPRALAVLRLMIGKITGLRAPKDLVRQKRRAPPRGCQAIADLRLPSHARPRRISPRSNEACGLRGNRDNVDGGGGPATADPAPLLCAGSLFNGAGTGAVRIHAAMCAANFRRIAFTVCADGVLRRG